MQQLLLQTSASLTFSKRDVGKKDVTLWLNCLSLLVAICKSLFLFFILVVYCIIRLKLQYNHSYPHVLRILTIEALCTIYLCEFYIPKLGQSITKSKEISRTKMRVYSVSGNIWSWNNDPDKGRGRKTKKIWEKGCEGNLRSKEISGRSLLTDELRGPGKITSGGHCESYRRRYCDDKAT